MPKVTGVIKADGSLEVHVEGVKGPGCTDIEKLLAEILGESTSSVFTAEYFERVNAQTKTRQSGR